MEPTEHTSNAELLSSFAGKPAAELIVRDHPSLISLAHASFDELQRYRGVGKSKAAAIRAAFLLAQRLGREALPESPSWIRPSGLPPFSATSSGPWRPSSSTPCYSTAGGG
ncbi:MAG: hypothetical protein M5U12_13240 [Verrucomicrobia bacterium]|nr:hypothetical protein [Verrucomicrobiota bacterium]